jgi:alkylation response protein AidB-like acyl-CoA dehydrogenase
MKAYSAPLGDHRFLMETWPGATRQWARLPALADVDAATAMQVLEHAAVFAQEVLAPLNASGDGEGCALDRGEVRTPGGFRAAYQAFVRDGWASLGHPLDIGGQGLPQWIDIAFHEMQVAANHAWAMYPGLLHGAVEVIRHHAAQFLQDRYLASLVCGDCLAAMGLTESHAGSDLGSIRTRAKLQADGSVLLEGEKLFMSGGDHDLTANILHLVLCRLEDAPAGTRGLSLALVPKILPGGERNAVTCEGIERKLGLHGSATCAVRYQDARGWLVGEPHQGLRAMFLMMNSARLRTGVQGIAHADAALQLAQAYAAQRRQGRSAHRSSGGAAVIAEHPAVARKLAAAGAFVEGARALAAYTALRLDHAVHDPVPQQRAWADEEAGLLTPLVKAFFTQQGFRQVNELLQVFGGYGYVADYGIEQKLRDARSALIYEGTNEIQAIDLLVRKVLGGNPAAAGFDRLMARVRTEVAASAGIPELAAYCATLNEHVEAAEAAVQGLRAAHARDPELALHVTDDFLSGWGWLLLGWVWMAAARAAREASDAATARHKLRVARHGFTLLLDDALAHWRRIERKRRE